MLTNRLGWRRQCRPLRWTANHNTYTHSNSVVHSVDWMDEDGRRRDGVDKEVRFPQFPQ